jgi:hypothetical protein
MNYTTSSRYAVPQSFITKSKQRLKQHIDTVYLNNGDEFEIELYNPTSNKVLAKIELNGKSIGNGIILRPGERVFLERYLDEAKKFLFETYVVNGNNQEVKNAIANNGDVVVKFYDETVSNQYSGTLTVGQSYPWWSTTGTSLNYPPGVRTFTTNNLNNAYFTNTSGISGTFDGTITTSNYSYTSNSIVNDSNVNYTKPKTSEIRHVETGRVEKGSDSNQSFTYDNTSFNSYQCKTNWWKLKPISTKVLVKEDLVVYCTECGSKRKKDNHKFCPNCGTKF